MKIMALCLVVAAGISGQKLLVYPGDLASMENVLFVDVRPKELFTKGHIKGAAHLDGTTLATGAGPYAGPMKPADALRASVAAAGLDPTRRIVIYGSAARPEDVRTATSLFWALEYLGYDDVSLLDGGYEGWVQGSQEIETGESRVEPVQAPALAMRREALATVKDVHDRMADQIGSPVDFRPTAMYAGVSNDPASSRLGHIPRAKNVPEEELFVSGALSAFKPVYQLESVLTDRGVETNTPTIAYSNSGPAGSIGYFVLRLTGRAQVSLYDASMAEWGNDSQLPLEMPVQPPASTE